MEWHHAQYLLLSRNEMCMPKVSDTQIFPLLVECEIRRFLEQDWQSFKENSYWLNGSCLDHRIIYINLKQKVQNLPFLIEMPLWLTLLAMRNVIPIGECSRWRVNGCFTVNVGFMKMGAIHDTVLMRSSIWLLMWMLVTGMVLCRQAVGFISLTNQALLWRQWRRFGRGH